MNVDSRVILHAGDYLEKEMHFCFNSQEPMIQVIQTMDHHPFVKWLGKQSYFKMAKDRLEGHAIVIDEANPRRSEFRKHFALEGLFAFSLWSVKDMERLLPQVVVHKTEHEAMMKLLEKLHSFLMEGKMYFGNGVKQQLLTVFIDDLVKNPGYSPFSSKKDHDLLLRHTFIKHFMQGLSRIYVNVTDTLITDVTIEIVDYIFNSVDRSELQKLIKKIKSVVEDENRLLTKTVYEVYKNGL